MRSTKMRSLWMPLPWMAGDRVSMESPNLGVVVLLTLAMGHLVGITVGSSYTIFPMALDKENRSASHNFHTISSISDMALDRKKKSSTTISQQPPHPLHFIYLMFITHIKPHNPGISIEPKQMSQLCLKKDFLTTTQAV